LYENGNLGLYVIQAGTLGRADRGGRKKSLRMIQHILAIYGAGSAITTLTFLVFCWRAAEAPYND
jgi:hypothetical protein